MMMNDPEVGLLISESPNNIIGNCNSLIKVKHDDCEMCVQLLYTMERFLLVPETADLLLYYIYIYI